MAEIHAEIKNNPAHDFEFAFLAAKGGLIVILLLLTAFYQFVSKDAKYANTYFSNSSYMQKALGAASVTGIIASLTFLYVLAARGSIGLTSVYILLLIFIMLFIYDVAMEASGTNKWMANSELILGKGSYAVLNDIDPTDTETQQMLTVMTIEKNPYYDAIMKTFSAVIVLGAIYLGYVAINAFIKGYTSGNSSASNILYWGKQSTDGAMMNFSGELLFMAFNGLIPIMAALIRGEEITESTWYNVAMFGLGSVFLHIMLQYTGVYDSLTKYKGAGVVEVAV